MWCAVCCPDHVGTSDKRGVSSLGASPPPHGENSTCIRSSLPFTLRNVLIVYTTAIEAIHGFSLHYLT